MHFEHCHCASIDLMLVGSDYVIRPRVSLFPKFLDLNGPFLRNRPMRSFRAHTLRRRIRKTSLREIPAGRKRAEGPLDLTVGEETRCNARHMRGHRQGAQDRPGFAMFIPRATSPQSVISRKSPHPPDMDPGPVVCRDAIGQHGQENAY